MVASDEVISFVSRSRKLPSSREYLQVLYKRLEKLWKRAIVDFVEATINKMSVDTGMSVATLLPLAKQVRAGGIVRAKMAGGKHKGGFKNLNRRFKSNNARFKSREFGRTLGEKAYKIEFGDMGNIKFEFNFDIVAFQHYLRENNLSGYANTPAWNSLEAGKIAFLKRISTWKELVPSISKWFVTGEVI